MAKNTGQTIVRILQFILKEFIYPAGRLLRTGLTRFFIRHRPKLTAAYWRKVRAGSSTGRLILKAIYRGSLFLLLCLITFYLAVYMGFFGELPTKADLLAKRNNTASEVYSADGVLLGRYYIQDRTNVKYKDIAPVVTKALLATEDVRFYEHDGIDTKSLLRVFFKSLLLQEESSGGGSTLSQQLAKNLYPRKEHWILTMPVNKLREIIIARRLESIYNKEEILELYLNTVPMGGNLYGIERASRRFFNTSADSIKTEEAAVLIGMLKATTTYNPRLNPERAKERRNVVLSQMAKYNFIPAAAADSLKERPLKLRYRYETHNDGMAPYFREQLRLELVQWCSTQTKENGEPYNLYTDGLKIYTTIDAGLQAHAERAVRKKMAQLQSKFDAHWKGRTPWGNNTDIIKEAKLRSDRYKKLKAAGKTDAEIDEIFREPIPMRVFSWQGTTERRMSPLDSVRYYQKFLNTGLLSVEPQTGYIRAWVGGINHHAFKYDHVRSRRQAGSTFKPFVYAAALERGIEPCTYFENKLVSYPEYENWTPKNSNDQYGGEYSMRGALAHSVNTISAQVLLQTGINNTVSLAHRLGIKSNLPEVPALALGVASVSLYEMVSAYSAFANDGVAHELVYIDKITDRDGNILRQHRKSSNWRKATSPETAATMLRLMQGVVEEGSAAKLRSEYKLAMDIAGKTGTTQDHADGWFIGITPDLVTGVWVGAESPVVRFRTLALGSGSNTALPLWGEYMNRITRDSKHSEMRNSKFRPIPYWMEERLACASVLEEQIEEPGFIEQLFESITGKRVRSYEDWKDEAKRSRKEEKKRRKEREREQERGRRRGEFWW